MVESRYEKFIHVGEVSDESTGRCILVEAEFGAAHEEIDGLGVELRQS
jgi:hypothetical protein